MRVCIPIADSVGGGVHSFYRNFRKYLAGVSVPVTDDLAGDYDVLLANSWVVPYRAVARAKRAHPAAKVLHRIDGSAADYGREATADLRQALVNLLADTTVFQSAYGRDATRRRRIIGQDGPVIHNPVDVERFRPDGERVQFPGAVRIAHVAFSTNARKGSAGVWALARRRPDIQFIVVGRYDDPPALANLTVVGYADWDRLPAILRSCHVLLILAENETCPNVVLEALASGLPVLYKASGGTAELVGPCGAAVDRSSFDARVEEVMDRHAPLAHAARARAVSTFAFDVIFPRYLAVVDRAARRPLPGALDRLGVIGRLGSSPSVLARWLASKARGRRPAPMSSA